MPWQENLRPWKPGQSGNPSGYSKQRRVTDEILRMLDDGKGIDKALAQTMVKQALKGNARFMSMLLNRVEGPVRKELDVTSAGEQLQGAVIVLEPNGRDEPSTADHPGAGGSAAAVPGDVS